MFISNDIRNVRLGIRRRMENGTYVCDLTACGYIYKDRKYIQLRKKGRRIAEKVAITGIMWYNLIGYMG